MCGRLGEQQRPAVEGVRRADATERVEPAPGHRGGPGPQRGVAGGRLQPDAVGGPAAGDQQVARPGRAALAVAEGLPPADRVGVEDRRAHREHRPVTEPQRGAGAGADREVRVRRPQPGQLVGRQVADPDRGAGEARQPRGDHVVDQTGGLGEVTAVGQRQVQRDPRQPSAPGGGGDVPELARGHAVAAHAGHPLQHVAGAGLALEQRGQVVRSADGVDDPVVQRRVEVGGEGAPGGQHEQPAVVPAGELGELGVGADRDGVDPQPGGLAGQPAQREAVAVALADRDDRGVGVDDRAQVGAPAVAVDGQREAHRALLGSAAPVSVGSCRGRRPCRAAC